MLDVPRTALLIVDVQKDFCEGGALAVRGGDQVVPLLNQVIRLLTPQGALILASRDWHPARTTHFRGGGGAWPPHCVAGTAGAAFHEDLQLPAGTIWISKGQAPGEDGYSAFDGTTPEGHSLSSALADRRIERLYVGGLATDYCVQQTVLDALAHGLVVTVITDAVAAVELAPGDGARALDAMTAAGATLATSGDLT